MLFEIMPIVIPVFIAICALIIIIRLPKEIKRRRIVAENMEMLNEKLKRGEKISREEADAIFEADEQIREDDEEAQRQANEEAMRYY